MGGKVVDNTAVTSAVSAGLETEATAPLVPCPECGAETKEHHPVLDGDGEITERRRICSHPGCREIMSLS